MKYKEPERVFTKEQKAAFRKCSLIRYLARNRDGTLCGYSHKPIRARDGWIYSGSGGNTYVYLSPSISSTFPQITWKDKKPTSREEILGELRLTEEMAQAMSDFELEDSAHCDIELSRHLIAKGYCKQSDTAREFLKQLKDLLHKHEYRSQRNGVSFFQMDAESFWDEINDLAAQYGVNPEEV